MTRLEHLILEARSGAQWRGHTMSRFRRSKDKRRAVSDCVNCGKGVAVDTKPMPNGIDIGGPAIAIGCND